MSTAQTPISPPTSTSTAATPTRNRSMDQQYPRPFFGHLMSIENLRPLTRRCDSSSLTHHATIKSPNKPIYIPHCPQCAQRPVICNYCQVPVNKKPNNNSNNNNNNNCPTVATTGISRTNVNNMGILGNNNNYQSQNQSQTTRNNYDNDNNNNNNNSSNNIIRSATQSHSSQSIRKQPSDHNQNYSQVVNQGQSQNQSQKYADNSQLVSNIQNMASAGSGSGGECSCQPPLIFPSFRPVVNNSPRCGWPMKPHNLGAYPRLPGQSPEDPPCFSQTIAHRPSQIVVPELYTAAAARPVQPNQNYNSSFQSPSSFGALGDCCTTRRSSTTQFTPYKSHNSNPSNPTCCGDDDSHRSSYNN